MRTKIKTVTNPMVIRADIMEYRPNRDAFKINHPLIKRIILNNHRMLRIKMSTDKVETKLERTGIVNHKEVFSFTKKPLWINFRAVWCHKNRKTRYKDFIYLLRNPHASLMFVNSEIDNLKRLANAIIQGYKIIFPRETRYYGEIKNNS